MLYQFILCKSVIDCRNTFPQSAIFMTHLLISAAIHALTENRIYTNVYITSTKLSSPLIYYGKPAYSIREPYSNLSEVRKSGIY